MTNQYVINTNLENFAADVLVSSNERPVLVDFWADWCGPCKSIAPVLEQLALEFEGGLLVVKVDTDAEQELAQQYGIRSLPTMMIFRDGECVQQLVGAQPANAIKAALEPYMPRSGDSVLPGIEAARETGDLTGALAAVTTAVEQDPNDHRLSLLQADIMLDLGDVNAAHSILSQLPVAIATSEEAKRIDARLQLVTHAKKDFADDEIGSKFKQATELATAREYEESLEILLELITSHRDWQDGLVRETIVNIFSQMDTDDPLLKTYRTKLARTLN